MLDWPIGIRVVPDLYSRGVVVRIGLGHRSYPAEQERPPAVPQGPFYVSVPRGDDPPSPPMSSDGEGLDDSASSRPPRGPESPMFGVRVSVAHRVCTRPEDTGGWPVRLFELAAVDDLRWEPRRGRDGFDLLGSTGAIGNEIASWRLFGPHGEGAPELIEAIWALTPDQVARLPEPVPRCSSDAIEVIGNSLLISAPGGELERAAQNATGAIVRFFEARTWSLGIGGGFYYRGCYFTWIVSEPRWLLAMNRAFSAAFGLIGGPSIDPALRDRALAEWAELTAGSAKA